MRCVSVACLAAVALAACGGGSGASNASGQSTLDIYSSFPLHGALSAQSRQLIKGEELALSQQGNKAGNWTVNFISLDDSTATAKDWSEAQTTANAHRAQTDPRAILYIGDSESGASATSAPILNEAGIPQISPASTYVGLTVALAGVTKGGEPQAYFPTGRRTFLRIVPIDTLQAAADLTATRDAGCRRLAVANDGHAYGSGLAALLELEKSAYGVRILGNTRINPAAHSFSSYAAAIKAQRANCFLFAGTVQNGGVQITKDVHAALPKAKIFGPDGMCTSAWTNPRMGGVPASIAPRIRCTVATLDLKAYPGGRQFLAAYKARYGNANPDPYAIFGYEAMKLGLDTIAELGQRGNGRPALLAALFAVKDRHSFLGIYGFDRNGDTTLKSYGLYKVGRDGNPAFLRTITPGKIF